MAKIFVVVLLLGAAFGLISVEDLRENLSGSADTPTVQGPGNPSEARKSLRRLEVAPPGSMAGYRRITFPTGRMPESLDGTSRIPPATSGRRP